MEHKLKIEVVVLCSKHNKHCNVCCGMKCNTYATNTSKPSHGVKALLGICLVGLKCLYDLCALGCV